MLRALRPGLAAVVFLISAFAASAKEPSVEITASAAVSTLLFDSVDTARGRTVPIKVYHTAAGDPKPVILFSHGLGGSREGNPYLGNHWAENGYVVVFVQHPGSDRSVWESVAPAERMTAMKEAAGLKAMLDRLGDIPFVLDQLEKWQVDEAHPLFGKLDLEHIGMSGHSFGAVTTMGLTGRKYFGDKDFSESRIDAFLAMSPQPGKGIAPEKAFGQLKSPILCMTGTEDASPIDGSLQPDSRRDVYRAFPDGDKFQLVLYGAEHSAFGEGERLRGQNPDHHPVILEISTRFWNAYLKDDEGSKAWLQSTAPAKVNGFDPKDVWEWK